MRIKLDNLPSSQKINCIKAARHAFADEDGQGLGLKDAKDAVEAAMAAQKGDSFSMEGEANPKNVQGDLDAVRTYICDNGSDEAGFRHCGMPYVKVSEVKAVNIDTKGTQVLNVPNTEEGRKFCKQLAKFLNRPQYAIRRRGRGKRPSRQYHDSLPLPMADWLAIYIDGGRISASRSKANADNGQRRQAELKAERLERENASLRRQVDEANMTANNYAVTISERQTERDRLNKECVRLMGVVDQAQRKQSEARNVIPPTVLKTEDGNSIKIIGATEIIAL